MNIDYKERDKRFNNFIEELELLSKKYGVFINSTGGVNIWNKEDIKDIDVVEYSNDPTSGDLEYQVFEIK